jgi:hypothetical protein
MHGSQYGRSECPTYERGSMNCTWHSHGLAKPLAAARRFAGCWRVGATNRSWNPLPWNNRSESCLHPVWRARLLMSSTRVAPTSPRPSSRRRSRRCTRLTSPMVRVSLLFSSASRPSSAVDARRVLLHRSACPFRGLYMAMIQASSHCCRLCCQRQFALLRADSGLTSRFARGWDYRPLTHTSGMPCMSPVIPQAFA